MSLANVIAHPTAARAAQHLLRPAMVGTARQLVPVVCRIGGVNRGFLSVSAPSLAPWASIDANLPRKNLSLELDAEGSMKLFTTDRVTGETVTAFNLQSDLFKRWITEWEIQEKLWSGSLSQKTPEEREQITHAIAKVSEEVEAQFRDLAEKMSVADADRLRKQADCLKEAMAQDDVKLTELRDMMRALQAQCMEVAVKTSGHPHWQKWQNASAKRCWKGHGATHHEMPRWQEWYDASAKRCGNDHQAAHHDTAHSSWVWKLILGMAMRKLFR